MFTKRLAGLIAIITAAAATLFLPAAAVASFGIDPGKVYIDNLYPGAQGEFTITVYNQSDEDAVYDISPRIPDYTDPEYEPFTYLDWIEVTPQSLPVSKGGKADVLVVVKMPEDASHYSGKKGEAWISFTLSGDTAMVQVEIAARVFISTRPDVTATATTPADATTQATTADTGSVGISVDAQQTPTVSVSKPTPEATNAPSTSSGYDWRFPGAAAGVIIVAGAIYILINKKRRNTR